MMAIRHLSRETVENIVKKCLSFEASVRQGYYITFTCWLFRTLNSADLLFYIENNPRKLLYNISKSALRKTAYSLSYIRIEGWLKKFIAKDSNGWKHIVRPVAVKCSVFHGRSGRGRLLSTPKCTSFATLFIELYSMGVFAKQCQKTRSLN
jgi:hypothetical protein